MKRPPRRRIVLGPDVDKYDPRRAVAVDCASRREQCGAACCRMIVPLSIQDLEEGTLRWDPAAPYFIARTPEGTCAYLSDELTCTCFELRPAVCRDFDCREDPRIWTEFAEKIPHPDVDRFPGESSDGAPGLCSPDCEKGGTIP